LLQRAAVGVRAFGRSPMSRVPLSQVRALFPVVIGHLLLWTAICESSLCSSRCDQWLLLVDNFIKN
jgi:hypothetical protein